MCLAALGVCSSSAYMSDKRVYVHLSAGAATWDTGQCGLSCSSHMQYHKHAVRISCTHMYSASRSAATLSEIVACQTLLLLHLHTHCMSGQAATGYSYQLIFLKDKSVPSDLSTANYWHDPIQASQRQSEQTMMRVVACDPLAFFFIFT